MTTTTMSDAERRELLIAAGMNPDGPSLTPSAPSKPAVEGDIVLAPDGINPHAMPVSDIVFDPRLLDGFPDLSGSNYKAASEYVFALYRSPGRDKVRNPLLHRRITEFIGQVSLARRSGMTNQVREKVKATKEQRELAALMAAKGLTVEDLAALIGGGE